MLRPRYCSARLNCNRKTSLAACRPTDPIAAPADSDKADPREAGSMSNKKANAFRWTDGLAEVYILEYAYDQNYSRPSMTQMVRDRSPQVTSPYRTDAEADDCNREIQEMIAESTSSSRGNNSLVSHHSMDCCEATMA